MRQIKFRMWNEITKVMIDLKKLTPLALNMETDGLFIPFCGMPLMQFTGLIDKEGREIWEGDILQFDPQEWAEPNGEGHKTIVKWCDRHACFISDGSISDWGQWCEVISNIYESKES